MNILIITAHPSTLGHTHMIATTYKEEHEKLGNSVVLIDLYKEENALPFLRFEKVSDLKDTPTHTRMKEHIMWAHEIVFVHPVWWGTVPAIMKNFLDHILQAHFAFRYSEKGRLIKMLCGKKAKVFVTAGGPTFIYHIPGLMPLKRQWTLPSLSFCGIGVSQFLICGKMNILAGEEKDRVFATFLEKVKKSAHESHL